MGSLKEESRFKHNLFREANALAVNGVPIFNPIMNDGKTETFIAVELADYGGHKNAVDQQQL